jgi:hypothetical protein
MVLEVDFGVIAFPFVIEDFKAFFDVSLIVHR